MWYNEALWWVQYCLLLSFKYEYSWIYSILTCFITIHMTWALVRSISCLPKMKRHVSSCWGVFDDSVNSSSLVKSFTDPSRIISLHEIASTEETVKVTLIYSAPSRSRRCCAVQIVNRLTFIVHFCVYHRMMKFEYLLLLSKFIAIVVLKKCISHRLRIQSDSLLETAGFIDIWQLQFKKKKIVFRQKLSNCLH